MLTDQQKEILLKNIDKKIKFIEEDLIFFKKATQPIAPENSIGRLSRMDAIQNKGIAEASVRNLEEKLSNLKKVKALKDSRDFGLCVKCKAEIPVKRFLAVPEQPYCMSCSK